MKKLLLFMMVIGFVFSGMAQNQYVSKKNDKRALEGTSVNSNNELPTPILNTKAVNEDVNRITVGVSDNQRSFRREEPHVITYNAELDLISLTMTIDPATYDEASALGVIAQFYSTDHGQTWQGPVVLADNTGDGFQNYYPAGMTYNPTGNTSVTGAYGVSQSTNTIWNYHVFGSSSLGGENYTTYLFEDTDPDFTYNGYWNQFGLRQVGDEVRCMNIIAEGDWSNFVAADFSFITAEFDGAEFDWDMSNTLEVDILQGADDVIEWTGMYVGMDAGAEIAWSNDGQTGYAWMVGVSNEDATGYQPIVYKTTDGGDSWDYIYLDFLDDDMQEYLYPYLIDAGGTSLVIPHIFESTGLVDADGNLQLLTAMGSSSSDVINYPDSIGYHWVYPGDLFNVTVDDDGIAAIMWIDSLRTENVLQDAEGSYNGTGWGHRLYMAKNANEDQMFYTWSDTRDAANQEFNVEPDIFGFSIGFCANADIMEAPVCFTEGTLYEKFYYFTCAAEEVFINDDGNYSMPYIQAVSPGEFVGNGSATADPVTVNYITGIEFPDLCPVGISEMVDASAINVTQNQPNPFNGETYIEVSTQTAAPVMVEVSNIMGQSIYTLNAGTVNGSKTISLNSENMEAGVYFYTVSVGSQSITKKMVVK